MVDDGQAEHARVEQRAAQQLRRLDRRTVVGIAEHAGIGQLTHGGELLPCPPGGDGAVDQDLDGRAARPGSRADALEDPGLVCGGRGVRHQGDCREAAVGGRGRAGGDRFGVFETGLAEMGVEIEEARGHDHALRR